MTEPAPGAAEPARPTGTRRLALAAAGCFALGATLLVFVESGAVRIVAVALLLAWLVLGAAAIANPEDLARKPGEEDVGDAPPRD